jgi:hypothetical protein
MNGLPLVVLGVMFFTMAYALLKVQGKIGDVSKAVNLGFKTIEDAISKNFIDPDSPLDSVSEAVDLNFKAIQDGLSQGILGPNGALAMVNTTLTSAGGVAENVATEIRGGRYLLTGTIAPIIGQTQDIFYDIGNPLNSASASIHSIGDWIDVEILNAHPFEKLAKPFEDVANTVGGTGALCVTVGDRIGSTSGQITAIASKLDNIHGQVISLKEQTDLLRRYVDRNLRDSLANFSGEMDKVNSSIDGVLTAFRGGAQVSLKELGNAQALLDSTLSRLVNRQWITALAAAGIALILAGVSIGI